MEAGCADLVSVIIPVYKVEQYLDGCVKSVISQTYGNLEIILVDDGSPDSCPKLCDAWAKKDKRIKVIHKKNGGLSEARNVGIEQAKGKYLAFVDSDDYIDRKMVEKLYARLKKDNSEMAICGIYLIDNRKKKNSTLFNLEDTTWSRKEFWEYYHRKGDFLFIVAWNKLYSAKLFANERYNVGKLHEDEFIFHRLIEQCQRISLIGEGLYYYRKRNESITAQYSWRRMDTAEALLDRSQYFAEKNKFRYALVNLRNIPSVLSEAYVRLNIGKNLEYQPRYEELRARYYSALKKKYWKKERVGIFFGVKFFVKEILFHFNPRVLCSVIKIWGELLSWKNSIFTVFSKILPCKNKCLNRCEGIEKGF